MNPPLQPFVQHPRNNQLKVHFSRASRIYKIIPNVFPQNSKPHIFIIEAPNERLPLPSALAAAFAARGSAGQTS